MISLPPTPFSSVLDTNYAPSPVELSKIRALLDEPEQRLRALNEEIGRLQVQRDAVEAYITRHRMLLSPFRRIPVDIWREIFVHALPSEASEGLPCRTLKEAPLILTIICRSWREIALETPRLWNRIQVHLPREHFDNLNVSSNLANFEAFMNKRKTGVRTWLDRSGSLPITISISLADLYAYRPNLIRDFFAEFTALLVEFSRRLKVVKISSDIDGSSTEEDIWKQFTGLHQEDLPVLTQVELSGGLFTYSDHDPNTFVETQRQKNVIDLISRITSIQSLRFGYVPSVSSLIGLRLHWETLRHLEVRSCGYLDPTTTHFLAVFAESCPSLSSLVIGVRIQQQDSDDITHPNLPVPSMMPQTASFRRLDITVLRGNGPFPVRSQIIHDLFTSTFQAIHTPHLKHFTFRVEPESWRRLPIDVGESEEEGEGDGYKPITALYHDLIARSRSPITCLTIDDFTSQHPALLLLSMDLLPGLRSLELDLRINSHWAKSSARLERFLCLLVDDSTICPNLNDLSIRYAKVDSKGLEAICAFGNKRAGVKYISIHFGVFLSGSTEEELVSSVHVEDTLKRWREKGIQVEWSWEYRQDRYSELYDNPKGRRQPFQPPKLRKM